MPPQPGSVDWDPSAPFTVECKTLRAAVAQRWPQSCRVVQQTRTGFNAVINFEWCAAALAAAPMDALLLFGSARSGGQ